MQKKFNAQKKRVKTDGGYGQQKLMIGKFVQKCLKVSFKCRWLDCSCNAAESVPVVWSRKCESRFAKLSPDMWVLVTTACRVEMWPGTERICCCDRLHQV